MRQALVLCAAPEGFLLYRSVRYSRWVHRASVRDTVDLLIPSSCAMSVTRLPWVKCIRSSCRCRGVSSSSTAKGRFTSRRRICWRLSSCCPCCHSCRLAISSGS